MSEKAERLASQLEQFAPGENESPLRRLESLAIGRPIWRLVDRYYQWRLERLLPDEDSTTKDDRNMALDRRRIRALANRANDRVLFGRRLNLSMKCLVNDLDRGARESAEARDLVYGRIVRPDGRLREPASTVWIVFALGVLWHLIALSIFLMLTVYAWVLPGHFAVRLGVSLPLVGMYLYIFGHINAISIRPALTVSRYLRQQQ